MFAPIPGVFETPYQTAPLDIRSDAFYESKSNWNHCKQWWFRWWKMINRPIRHYSKKIKCNRKWWLFRYHKDSRYQRKTQTDIMYRRQLELWARGYIRDSRGKRKRGQCLFGAIIYISKKCIGPLPLASLCKLLFEEYGQRQSGMPDLW